MATKAKRKAARDRRRRAGAGAAGGTSRGVGSSGAAGVDLVGGTSSVDGGAGAGVDGGRSGAKAGAPARAKGGRRKAQGKGPSRGRATARHPKHERYTPPTPKNARKSPTWMGWAIVGLFLLGVLIIILNYADVLPGGVDNWWLVGAIASIFAGLMVATQYR